MNGCNNRGKITEYYCNRLGRGKAQLFFSKQTLTFTKLGFKMKSVYEKISTENYLKKDGKRKVTFYSHENHPNEFDTCEVIIKLLTSWDSIFNLPSGKYRCDELYFLLNWIILFFNDDVSDVSVWKVMRWSSEWNMLVTCYKAGII